MKWVRNHLLFLTALLLAVVPLANVFAQEAPSTPIEDSIPTGILAEFDLIELPGPTAVVFMVRTTIAVDFQNAPEEQNGPLILLVESGTLLLDAKSAVTVTRDGDTTTDETGEIVLGPGSAALVPARTAISYANTGGEPVLLLMLLIVSNRVEAQGEASSGEIIQIADRGVAVGIGDFPPMAGSVRIERVVAQPGETIEGPGVIMDQQMPSWMGIDIGMVEAGSAELTLSQRSMYNMIMPDAGPALFVEPTMFTLSATDTLTQGDSYASYNSALSWTVVGDEPLTILRVVVAPDFFP